MGPSGGNLCVEALVPRLRRYYTVFLCTVSRGKKTAAVCGCGGAGIRLLPVFSEPLYLVVQRQLQNTKVFWRPALVKVPGIICQ